MATSSVPTTANDVFSSDLYAVTITDTDGEQEPVIVDCDVLEAAKENIRPLASGRRVTALAGILSTPHAHREQRLAATRTRLRTNVALALEDADNLDPDADPLEAYTHLVNWVVENYPQGPSAESGLLELLEEATRTLKDQSEGKWRSDLRYLKLWVMYAGYVERPSVIYRFCLVNEIGTNWSMLYEEMASVLERDGRKSEADEIYNLGIARRAEPLERLESKHREFQKRMMSSPSLPSTAPSATDSSSTTAATTRASSKRVVLGEAPSKHRITRSSTRTAPPESSSSSSLPSAPRPNAPLQVFVDPTGDEAAVDPPTAAPWQELGTRKTRVKENIREATKAAGTTIKQTGKAERERRVGSRSSIPVFRDTDSTDMPPPPVPHSRKPSASSSGKGKMAIFRDDTDNNEITASLPAPAPTKAKVGTRKAGSSKSGIAVFKDDDPQIPPPLVPAPRKASTSSTRSKVTVFRDEKAQNDTDMPLPAASNSRKMSASSKSKMTYNNDDVPTPVPSEPAHKAHIPSTTKLIIFRDDDPEPQVSVSKTITSSKIPVFRDSGDGSSLSQSLSCEGSLGTTSAGSGSVPSTPRSFTPYRDEDIPGTPTSSHARNGSQSSVRGGGGGLLLGLGGVGRSVKMSTEAEALRKDPLKNYGETERRSIDD